MSGLLVKDWQLMLQRRKSFLLFLILAVAVGFTMNGSFILGYLTILAMIMAIGTISYDELDNGYSFLMTLPVNEYTYAVEKTIFCTFFTIIGWIFALAVNIIICICSGDRYDLASELPPSVVMLCICLIIMSVIIPVQLKWGLEKSRIALLLIFGAVVFGGVILFNAQGEAAEKFIDRITASVTDVQLMYAALGAALAALIISTIISIKIMRDKEF